jgi:dTDP-4-dehydrorhamnose 3,5-epimerase
MKSGVAEPAVTGGPIDGVRVIPIRMFRDDRGWLAEIFRSDEVDEGRLPAMAYLSVTLPGVVRGPHAHRDQTDLFCFAGPSRFRLTLWDAREDSPTRGARMVVECGDGRPAIAVIPPGVVHAYRNIGLVEGLVVNCPDRLYAGRGRKEPVDEVRYEDQPGSPYRPE